jgi:predicted amidohydrolase
MSKLTLTLIQSKLHWEDKAANLRMFGEKIDSIGEKTEIVVLPETFPTGFSMHPASLADTMEGEVVQWMKAMAMKKRVILTGSAIIREGERFYNRLIWMLPNGEFGVYDKRHRFAYAGEDKEFTAGSKRLIASVKGWKINLLICYDLRFPVWSRQSPSGNDAEYDLLIYVANWPETRIHAWRTLLQARAIENQCYVVGVNRVGQGGNNRYNGYSMVVDPLGAVLYEKADEEDINTISLDRDHVSAVREKLPFLRDGDQFQILNAG